MEADLNRDLTPRAAREGLMTQVVQKQKEQWLIIAAQNDSVAP
jgi:hypothetical protein